MTGEASAKRAVATASAARPISAATQESAMMADIERYPLPAGPTVPAVPNHFDGFSPDESPGRGVPTHKPNSGLTESAAATIIRNPVDLLGCAACSTSPRRAGRGRIPSEAKRSEGIRVRGPLRESEPSGIAPAPDLRRCAYAPL